MFKTAEKTELNQISVTGMRAIVILGLLIIAPRSLEEIKQTLISLNIIDSTHSEDILRIDLNTLKIMGCELSRPTAKNNYKYSLLKHPFELSFTMTELQILKKVYNKAKLKSDLNRLIEYHSLFNKIATFVFDSQTKEALLGISILKYYDIERLKNLIIDCKHNNVVTLVYKNPTKKGETTKNILIQELVIKNDKIYIHGIDKDKKASTVLNLSRIQKILSRKLKGSDFDITTKNVKIVYKLKGFDIEQFEKDEKIIKTVDDGYIVEAEYYNDFLAMQRILSFGANCIVLEPENFKTKVIEKLKEMRDVYE